MSDDLVAFLRARLREDEATARAVLWDGSGNSLSWGLAASATVEVGNDEFNTDDRTVANHIVNNDPARVLAEIAAKRRIFELHRPDSPDRPECVTCGPRWPCRTVEALAAPYADHPDYREEWSTKTG